MTASVPDRQRQVLPAMRLFFFAASGLVVIVGLQLFVLSDQTDRFFAWTIKPPLTAAFMGAAYWSSFVLEFMAARERLWSRARLAVPAVLSFSILTLVATLLHIDKFHLTNRPPETLFFAWAWTAVYVIVPPLMLVIWLNQMRAPGADPVTVHPLPRALRGVVGLLATILVACGVLLFFLPVPETRAIWPWTLSELTARAIGAWLVGLGIAAAQLMMENDMARARPVFYACAAFGVLQAAALIWHAGDFQWGSLSGWIYLAALGSISLTGLYGAVLVRQLDRPQP